MPKQQESNIAVSFLNIHAIITRALRVSIETMRGFSQQDFKGKESWEGIFNYIRALVSVLNAHHLTEDEIAFPYFRDKLPEAPFDILSTTHQEIVHVLDEIKLVVEKYEKNDQLRTELTDLESALIRLNDMWHPHI